MLRDAMEIVVYVGIVAFFVMIAYSQHKGTESLRRENARKEAARKQAEARKAAGLVAAVVR